MGDSEQVTDAASNEGVRMRIVVAAARLIADGGRDAATTRAVATTAGVQAPTIYRLFGDKRGLLDAVAEHCLATYVAEKSKRSTHPDPVQDLREGWDTHVSFGLANPGLFAIMSGEPRIGEPSAAASAGLDVLQRRVRNIAVAGRLRVTEARAVALLQAACTGTVLTLLSEPEERRDAGLSEAAREAVLAAITSDSIASSDPTPRAVAAALRASLHHTSVLSRGERLLLDELLDRITDGD